MKAMARFTILLIALIALLGWLLSRWFETGTERHALVVSAVLASAVQMATFGFVQLVGTRNALVGWGMGAILRGTMLALYGLFLAKMLGLPLTAALVSFAIFLFASMLLESLLISNAS
jgi:hypothetical protein